jgi:O-antigen ligase
MVLVWEPLQKLILNIDGSGITISFLVFMLILILLRKNYVAGYAFKKPLVIWGLWIGYSFINTSLKGYGYDVPGYSFFTQIFVPLALMLIINIEYVKNSQKLLNVLAFGMYVSLLIILLFSKQIIAGRVGRDINFNTAGIMATVLLMILYFKYFHNEVSGKKFIILSLIPTIAVVSTGSRTAFGGLFILVLAHWFINRSNSNLKNIFRLLIGFVIVAVPINYILNSTALGERILSTTEQGAKIEVSTGNPILDKFGDRGMFYYTGWQVFKKNPVTGIGLGNYKFYNEDELVQHSEYMIQLTELGIIGFGLFIFFYYVIFMNIRKLRFLGVHRKDIELLMAYIVIILTMITATRMFREWYLFSVVGLVTGYIANERYLYRYNELNDPKGSID